MIQQKYQKTTITAEGQMTIVRYLEDVEQYSLLSLEWERSLIELAARGNAYAQRQLIEAHLPLVVSIARQYARNALDLEEFIQEGNLGLMHAAQEIDVSYPDRFETYARQWIRAAVRCVQRQRRREQVMGLLNLAEAPLSLDAALTSGDASPRLEDSRPHIIADGSIHNLLSEALAAALGEQERQMIILYFGLDESYGEIPPHALVQYHQNRFQQVRASALKKLQSYAAQKRQGAFV